MIKFGHESNLKTDKIPHVALGTVAVYICKIYQNTFALNF